MVSTEKTEQLPPCTDDQSDLHPVDRYKPVSGLVLFGLQHLLVMAAAPISTVFLLVRVLNLPEDMASSLMTSIFVFSGIGTLLQSLGRFGFGVRLPFVMLPGGASTILFLTIALHYNLQVAAGAVIITAIFYVLMASVFTRILKYFPTVVIGSMVTVIGINLIKIGGILITGPASSADYASLANVILAITTVGFIFLFMWLLRGVMKQLAVMLGLIAGTLVGTLTGASSFAQAIAGSGFSLPSALPFGAPEFVLGAAVPMLLWSLGSMAEATGQTVVNSELVGKELIKEKDIPKVLRADGIISLFGGFFGTPVMVTSGENIGIIRASGVKSRFVTATTGILLILIGVSPLAYVLNGIPSAVVGGTALIVFAMVAVLGIKMLQRVNLEDDNNFLICTLSLTFGLLPIIAPQVYSHFPQEAQGILDSGVAMSAIVAVIANILLNHVTPYFKRKKIH